jgi:hypothetical protein
MNVGLDETRKQDPAARFYDLSAFVFPASERLAEGSDATVLHKNVAFKGVVLTVHRDDSRTFDKQ